jgi:hypothetical protein
MISKKADGPSWCPPFIGLDYTLCKIVYEVCCQPSQGFLFQKRLERLVNSKRGQQGPPVTSICWLLPAHAV